MALIPMLIKANFYQQIRFLLRKLRDGRTSDANLLDENFHMVSTLSLDAPDGQVESLWQDSPDSQIKITILNHGLTGAMGALPTVYTEWLVSRQYRYSDRSAKAFLDLFGHRLYCLDYLAWQKNNLCALAESIGQPPLQMTVLALSGLLMSNASSFITQHASLFTEPVRSMINLERWLKQLYGVSVQIIPFTGGWCDVSEGECCQLGNAKKTLSTAPMLGRARLEVHAHFDVVLGPMSTETSVRFISSEIDIWAHVRDYVGSVVDFSVSLIISSTDFSPQPLGICALGLDLRLGHQTEPHVHRVRLTPPII